MGTQRWVSAEETLQYIVSFENVPDATAPAQEVIVTNPIDVNSDLNTLQLTGINLIGIQVPISPTFMPMVGLNEFATNVDLRPAQNLFVNVNAKLDPASRVLTWTFTSIDPDTGQLPVDAGIGFLPPGAGGNMSFIISPKTGLATGTEIIDQAAIVFDVFDPILTNSWINTIDATPPTSRVFSLPTFSPPNFTVNWGGFEEGAGIRDFTISVSDNGGPFTPWLTNTTDISGPYPGEVGHTYAFYSVARDFVGNVEGAKTNAEATTLVSESIPTPTPEPTPTPTPTPEPTPIPTPTPTPSPTPSPTPTPTPTPRPTPPPAESACNVMSPTAGCTVNGRLNQPCQGTAGKDTITGTSRNDIIFGLGDNDTINGRKGNDLVCGGAGSDALNGGDGKDVLAGMDGRDTLNGGKGNDKLNGEAGNDRLVGSAGNDVLDGGFATDTCDGGFGSDTAADCETITNVP